MTYTDTVIKPGPNLNMILGPNGTGKSAIVCSIIVGLAGEVSLTGRATNPAELVKKGTDSGSTEIELYNDRGQNYVIARKIIITNRSSVKIDHKSEWKLNGKAVNKSEVIALTRKLNIKVDNLCQFLPQDSVTSFVKMNNYELLSNTLKAAGDNQLVEDHSRLIDLTTCYDEKSQILSSLKKSCQENEVHARRLEVEVGRLREREGYVKERTICREKIHYVKYLESKNKYDAAKEDEQLLKAKLAEIEGNNEPFRNAMETHKEDEKRLRIAMDKTSEACRSSSAQIRKIESLIDGRKLDCQEEFTKFKGKAESEERRASDIRLKQQELDSLESKLIDIRDSDYSRQIKDIEKDVEEKRQLLLQSNQERSRNDADRRKIVADIERAEQDKDQIFSVTEKRKNLLMTRFPESYRVFDWLARNQSKFQKPISSPLMCEINVKDPRYANIIEHAINAAELSAFVCQTQDDLQLFTRLVRNELKMRQFNVILMPDTTLDQFHAQQRPNLRRPGMNFVGYLDELIEASEPIMRYLCGNYGFHRIPLVTECTESQLKQLFDRFSKFYVKNIFYTSQKSRYDGQIMTIRDETREARNLIYSFDKQRRDENAATLARLFEMKKKYDVEKADLDRRVESLKVEWQALADKHRELTNKQNEKSKLEMLIKRARNAIEVLQSERVDIEAERAKLQKSIDKINRQIVENLEKLVKIYIEYSEIKETHCKNVLLCRVATRNYLTSKTRFQDAQRDAVRLKELLGKHESILNALKSAMTKTRLEAEEHVSSFKDGKLHPRTKNKFDSVEASTVEALKERIHELEIRIQRIFKDNSILDEFNRQNEELKDKRDKIAELEVQVKELDSERDRIKSEWLPRLQDVIDVINRNYKSFMQDLSYDGQVELDYDRSNPNNFNSYGVMIKVKYRDNETLIPLSSTRQSGGERSVATMIYMLALQTKTTVPFRCVDEINQGMDKENERKVFELLVQTADSSSSQYFLVSPKLLSNLPYSEKMMIHVVYNGKQLQVDWDEIEVGA